MQYMSIAVDNVGRLRPLPQCPLDKYTTAVPIAGLTGGKPEARETCPIIMQAGIDRLHDTQNALKLARTAVKDQVTTKLRDDQQVTGIASDVGLGRCKVGIRVFKQRKEREDMRTFPGQRGFCRHQCSLFKDIGVR